MNRPNVIFLIVDSLRFDRMGLAGHDPSPTPAMDYWLSKGLLLRNAFAVGCPTEFAYPGLTTSTLPLDYGGYAQGITHRPKALAEVFRDAGYHTMRMVHDSFESDGAYERGFDQMLHFYDARRLHECAMVEVNHFRRLYRSGAQTLAQGVPELVERVRYKFREFASFARELQEQKSRGLLADSRLLAGYDYEQLTRAIAAEETLFAADPAEYARRIILSEEGEAFTFLEKFTESEREGRASRVIDGLNRRLMLRSLFSLLASAVRGRPNRQALRRHMHYLRHSHGRRVKFPSGGYLIKKLCDWVGSDHDGRPFFAWVHTVDVHEQNCWSYDMADGSALIEGEFASHRQLLRRIASRGGAYGGNPVYDLSVSYTDLQVDRLFRFLETSGRLADTVVVLTGDHGHNSAMWPVRSPYHVAEAFYDELYHVPVGFTGAGIVPRQSSALCSSLDIGSTLLGLIGLPIPPSFRGRDMGQSELASVNEVYAEHMGRGLCDLKLKPIKLSVRSNTAKLVYETAPGVRAEAGQIVQFYDLANDPLELTNLAAGTSHPEKKRLLLLAQRRVAEIRSHCGCQERSA